jgi:hypothetical protein
MHGKKHPFVAARVQVHADVDCEERHSKSHPKFNGYSSWHLIWKRPKRIRCPNVKEDDVGQNTPLSRCP